jgi:hypothetical protein
MMMARHDAAYQTTVFPAHPDDVQGRTLAWAQAQALDLHDVTPTSVTGTKRYRLKIGLLRAIGEWLVSTGANSARCARALTLIPSSAVLETLLTVRFFIGQGTLDDQEPNNLVYIGALTRGELRDNLGYPLRNFWGTAHSQLLR